MFLARMSGWSVAKRLIETVTQRTAATAEETAAGSEDLNAQAAASLAAVSDLGVLVGYGADVTSKAA